MALPLILGQRTPCLRDVLSAHAAWKAFGAQELRHGRIPAFNSAWGLGQPFRGNPNALPFYPGNLLFLILPFWSAFGSHFAFHWLLAFLAMWALARELGQGTTAALLAGVTYAGSGYLLSCLSFYNLLVVAAWWPLVAWGVARGGRRGVVVGGLACGMALLGGEPVTAALGGVPLLLIALERHGWRRGLAAAGGVGVLGLLVALPQIVASLRVLPFSYRGSLGYLPGQAEFYALHPLRLGELLLPMAFGAAGRGEPRSWWASEAGTHLPLFFNLYVGTMGLWLALCGGVRRGRWVMLAAAGVLLAWAGGHSGQLLVRVSGGAFRSPEKFLFWTVFAAALLAGWGLERVLRGEPWLWSWRVTLGASAIVTAIAIAGPQSRFEGDGSRFWASVVISLAIAGALLFAGAWAARRGQSTVLVLLQLAGLVQLYPLVETDFTRHYREPSAWVRQFAPGEGVVFAEGEISREELTSVCAVPRLRADLLGAVPAVFLGLRHPLAPDLEGTFSPLHSLLLFSLPRMDWEARLRWLRLVGVHGVVIPEAPQIEGLRLLDRRQDFGVMRGLYRVENSGPAVHWPRAVEVAPNPLEALKKVSSGGDPFATAVVPSEIDHHAGGEAWMVRETPDRLEIATRGQGGLAVVQRAYQPIYEARAGGKRLQTLPVDLVLLGAVVPPGDQRVVIEVPAGPEKVAGVVALATVALLGVCAIGNGRPQRRAAPTQPDRAEPPSTTGPENA